MNTTETPALQLARRFHEAYERLAPAYGYETRPDTRAFDPESKNGRLMVATCAALLAQAETAQPAGMHLKRETCGGKPIGHICPNEGDACRYPNCVETAQPASATSVDELNRLAEELDESAEEVMEFPHPSHCGHLHNANAVMCKAADAIRSLASSMAQPSSQWQDIATAPKGSGENGPGQTTHPDYIAPPRLLLATAEGIIVGYYDWYYHPGYGAGAEPGESAWRDHDGGRTYEVTHWQPLPPAPPTTGEKP